MLNFMKKNKGSISIFLCLAMVPMLLFSTMIVDASRLQAAKSVIAGAGDLSMNAALSEYEHILEDMYGIFATVKNEAEMQDALKSYFSQTIKGTITNGADDKAFIENLASQMTDLVFSVNDETTYDNLLQMQIDSLSIDTVSGSEVSNPAVLKRQIIDYMKYKGPVSLVSTIFDKLSFIKGAAKQTEVVQKKVTYVKNLSNVQDACKAALDAIELKEVNAQTGLEELVGGYNYHVNKYRNDFSYNALQNAIDYAKTNYEAMSRNIFRKRFIIEKTKGKKQYFTYELETNPENKIEIPEKPKDGSSINVYTSFMDEVFSDLNKIIYMDEGDGRGYFEDYLQYEATVNSDGNLIVTAKYPKDNTRDIPTLGEMEDWYIGIFCYPLEQNQYGKASFNIKTYADELYEHNICQEMVLQTLQRNPLYFSDICTAYEDFPRLYNLYKDAFKTYDSMFQKQCREDYVKANPKATEEEITAYVNQMLKADIDYGLYKHKEDLIGKVYGLMDPNEITYNYFSLLNKILLYLGETNAYDEAADIYAKEARSKVGTLYTVASLAKAQADIASEAVGEVVKQIEAADTAKEDWGTTIDSSPDGSSKSTMKSDYQTMTDGLEKADAEALKGVLDAQSKTLDGFVKQIEGITFLGYSICMTSAEKPTEKGSTFAENEVYTANFIESYDTYSKTIVNENFHAESVADVIAQGGYPYIEYIDGEPKETEIFYNTLVSVCKTEGTGLTQDQKNAVDSINSASGSGSNATTESLTPSEEETKPEQGGSKDSGDKSKKDDEKDAPASVDFSEIIARIDKQNKASQDANEETEEVSLKTENVQISKEGKDDYSGDAQKAEDSLNAAETALKLLSDLAATAGQYAYMEEYFTEMFTCQTDKKLDEGKLVLLNGYSNQAGAALPINANTEWFGNEIEYLIWGDTTLSKNLTKTEAWIYAIRFALNTVYAFTAADIQSFALEVATAIAGWTVIGVPIVQACITIGLALAESAYDLAMLKDGRDVVIYKSATTFACSPTGLLSTVAKEVVNKATEAAVSAIDDGLDTLSEKAYDTLDEAMDDIDAVVDSYIQQERDRLLSAIEDQFVTPILNKMSPVLAEVDKDISKIPGAVEKAFDEAWKIIGDNIENHIQDGMIKDLTKKLYERVNKDDNLKKNLVDTVTGYMETVVSGGTVEQTLREMLIGKNGQITRWMTNIASDIQTKLDTLQEEISQKIKEKGDEALGNLKNTVREELSKASESISGKITDTISDYAGEAISSVDSAATSGFTFNYKEYCKLIVFLKLIEGKENAMLKRAAALMEANVQNAAENANKKFMVTEAKTLVYVDAEVKIKTLFPWTVAVEESQSEESSQLVLDFSHLGENYVTMKYSALNGY